MAIKLTEEYLRNHTSENEEHFLEAGKLLSNAIMEDAINYVRTNGPSEKIKFSAPIAIVSNDLHGCVTVTYTRSDGSVLTYHRPT